MNKRKGFTLIELLDSHVNTTSYPSDELQNFRILRQIRVTKMSPQMSNLMIDGSTKPQIFA